jgi:hypothetical protein
MNTIEEHLDSAEEYIGGFPSISDRLVAAWHIQQARNQLKGETGKSQPTQSSVPLACLCGSEFYLVIQDRFTFKPVFSCPSCGRELDSETGGKLWASRRQL